MTRRGIGALALAATLLAVGPATGVASPSHGPSPTGRVVHLDPGLSTVGSAMTSIIVTAKQDATAAADAVRRLRGHVSAWLPISNGLAAKMPANRLRQLAEDSSVLAVTADRTAHLSEMNYDESMTASAFVKSTGASAAWATKNLGAGVGVAIIDTGASRVNDLSGRLVYGPDLSGEGTTVDTYGHGTVMAGIIGGSGADSSRQGRGAYTGIAPKATIVPVKVAGRNGSVDVSTMLQAMHWVAAYQSQFNIRVLNLSWGVPSTQHPSVDPLDYAVERLWQLGIVVVAAAGNSGPTPGTIVKPADDPLVITVGAYDDRGTGTPSDDSALLWSSRGPTAAGLSKPDIVAPGRKLVATRSYGSLIEASYPEALVANNYIRGSGTSEAAAVVSGLVALLLAQRSDLTPDQVKYLLRSTALPLLGSSASDTGAGRVQLKSALTASAAPAPVQQPIATGTGLLEASRGGIHVLSSCDGLPVLVIGEQDVHCEPWNGTTWTGTTWTGDSWTGTTWTSDAWTTATWNGTTWTGGAWTGASWLGAAPWTGTTWTGTTWTGTTWTGTTWTGTTWTGTIWTGTTWTATTSWAGGLWGNSLGYGGEFQSAFWGSAPPFSEHLPGEESLGSGLGFGGRALS